MSSAQGMSVLHAVPSCSGPGTSSVDVLEWMPTAFVLLDGDWRVRYLNAEAERTLGRERSHLLGDLWTAVPELGGTAIEAACRTAATSGRSVSLSAAHPRTPGGWCELHVWPGPDTLAIHLTDVTDRRRAEETARRAQARTTLLARLAAELAGALDGEAALGRLARLVVPTLTDACIVTVVDREGRARDVGCWHADPARRDLLEHYTDVRLEWLPPTSPVARALTAGVPVRESVHVVLGLMEPGPSADILRELRPESVVVLPLPAEARTVGVLTLYLDPGRELSGADLETAREVAVQAGRAVDRVHRNSQQFQLAEALQRSLLTDPPPLPGARVAVRYVPAAEAARIGGDWYDAFLLRDGTPVVVIGDVTGHDTAAAAVMGQLRGLLRGVAHAGGGGPADALRAFDEAVVAMHPDILATAALARLERSGTGFLLRWASAGHPVPLVVSPDGEVTLLGGTIGDLLIGVDPAAVRSESVTTLAPGDTVLLYTDGLVERRDATFDAGTARLVAAARDLAPRPLEEFCDAVLDRMLGGTPQDDVALVALRVDDAPGGPTPA